jgi:purine-cytosine permease-like protein
MPGPLPQPLPILTLAETLLSPWLVLPLTAAVLLAIGAHVMSVEAADMPAGRKRLRIVNGLVMMFVAAALGYALAVAPVVADPRSNPEQARSFVVVWLVIIALLTVVVAIAVADGLGALRAGHEQRRAIRGAMRDALAPGATRERADRDSGGVGRG